MSNQSTTILALLAAAAGSLLTSGAMGAVITFGTPTALNNGDSTGVSNFINNGPVFSAVSFGQATNAAAVTINGVTLVAPTAYTATTATASNVSLTMTPIITGTGGTNLGHGAFFSSANAPYTNLDANVQTVAKNAAFVNDNNQETLVLTYSNLVVGQPYQFEAMVNDSRGGTRTETLASADAGSTSSGPVKFTSTGSNGGVGQYVIGTFTADSATQVINITSATGQLNTAILEAVPEPASLGMLGLGGVALLRRRRA